MVRGKIDYSKGLIYKLCCKDTNIKEIYIGSTTNFRIRKNTHKTKCNNPKTAEYYTKKYKFIREHGGWENWEMILVEYYSATDRLDLRKRERYWYDELLTILNNNKPYSSEEERIEINKVKRKKNYKNNKEKIIEKSKKYYVNNKEKRRIYKKEYYENNKEKISIKRKEYYENNKEYVDCDCGSRIINLDYKKHLKSKKHIKWFNNNS